MNTNLLTRGELAKHGQVNPETIRYYERNGLLPLPERSEANYRLFAPNAVQRIRFIKRAQVVGFSLDEIKALLDLQSSADATSGDVRSMVDSKIREIDRKIAALQAMRDELSVLFDTCPGGDRPTDECPILERFAGDSSGAE
ncbi:MAG TPA: heavy metal-responsive transcriptional regulator [Phototrophicaceae bacterium]|nr:heavy metal-responsive transcriptional regulator [Phototrophicaceae bacterium]